MNSPLQALAGAPAATLLEGLWATPLPAALLDAAHRVVEVNEALAQLLGRTPQQLAGADPLDWQPAEDRAAQQEWRSGLEPPGVRRPSSQRGRLVDADGRLRWFAVTLMDLSTPGGVPLRLSLWHEQTAEHEARQQALRADGEIGQWFELSPLGMLVYDSEGLVLRSNAAFEALVERVPETLADAGAGLQSLLGWEAGALAATLLPGARAVERQAVIELDGGRRRRLWARLACQEGQGGERRVMAVVQDKSAEDERDIAQLEMGMLMDTGAIGVATFDPDRGWLQPRLPAAGAAAGDGAPLPQTSALMGVSRELVAPGSLADYERLQQALKTRQRVTVTYAVQHPELGQRWLQTRVEPAVLAGGRTTTSVVTRDVTEQRGAQARSQQLLHEMTTILDSSPAGIAYLRGPALVRCNRRFERMLGFAPGAAAGASLEEILARGIGPVEGVRQALERLADGGLFEAELPTAGGARGDGTPRWYSLTVRRAGPPGTQAEAVAVLTDITRLKQQQAELERSMRDRELMFTLSDVGIVYQRGARIERANPAMAALTGWSAPELATLDPAELYESTRACVDFEARIAEGLAREGRFAGERLLRRRDGSLRWVQVAVRPVAGREAVPEPLGEAEPGTGAGADSAAGMITSFVDIDERRRAREAVAGQAERTRAILDSVLVGIVTVSARGIEWMNRSARRMFAGELVDFQHEPLAVVATDEPAHPLRRDWLAQLADGTAETFECRLRGRDGRTFWVAGNAVTTRGASGQRELTFALLDIERRRQAEMRIAEAQASLQRLIETAPAAIALVDATTLAVRQANQTAATALGVSVEGGVADAALARALAQWLPAVVAAPGEPAQAREHEHRHEHGHEWRDDAAGRVWDLRLAPLAGPGDGDAGEPGVVGARGLVLLVASDVTAQRAAEQARLADAIAQREVLVREVHHRIKNNLQGVAGLLQQMAQKHPSVSELLVEAVGQVRAIAQVYGLQVGAGGPLALVSLVQAVATSVERMFVRSIRVEIDEAPPHELPEAESIPIALVLNELLTNAIKHGEGAAPLVCRLARDTGRPDGAVLAVAGPGRLPEGFELARHRSAVAGLGLVRALLPRRASSFVLEQRGGEVVAEVRLWPPALRLPAAPASGPAPASGSARGVDAALAGRD